MNQTMELRNSIIFPCGSLVARFSFSLSMSLSPFDFV